MISPQSSAWSTERRLLFLAAIVLFFAALVLTLSPAARERSWNADFRWSHWLGYIIWILSTGLIHWQLRRLLPDTEPYILPICALLAGMGIIMIWRLVPLFGLRQALWFALGSAVLVIMIPRSHDLHNLRRYKYLLLISGIALTGLTLVFGTNPLGGEPRLWLGCCGVYLQPSEPLKLILVIYLSAYLADNLPFKQGLFPLIFPTLIIAGIALLILFIQRDLGTASIFVFLYTAILFLATGRKRVLAASLFILVFAVIVGYYFIDIIQIRLTAWLNPWADPSGIGYQAIQSILAFANGGLPGLGPGLGYPGLVPVAISDFIFSAIGEEWGLFGTIAVLGLLAIMINRGIRTAMHAQDTFRRLLAAGLTTYLGVQSILIIGGNLRLLPLTGVTLPFVSYGGSSLITSMIAISLILIIGSQPEEDPAPLQHPKAYLSIAVLFFLLLLGLAITNSWWSVWRAGDLLTRTDNPRRSISDNFVPRGDIIDRASNPINSTEGLAGSFTRIYHYPDLGAITGYIHPIYGLSGLELSLDSYLRGLQGNPAISVWWNRLLYGTPPQGATVRLSLDLQLQSIADELLGGYNGSAIVMNAITGEILAMASHPTFDPSSLSETGEQVAERKDAPLLNRAAQGIYPSSVFPSLFAGIKSRELGHELSDNELGDLFSLLGFYEEPRLNLPVASPPVSGTFDNLQLSPLQIALAASSLANNGIRPPGQIAMAIQPLNSDWIVLTPADEDRRIFLPSWVSMATDQAMVPKKPYWRFVSEGRSSASNVAWFVGGTPSTWEGTPLIVVIALENEDSEQADLIGQELLTASINH